MVTVELERRYHVPRSQVWQGSRGRQAGAVHIHTLERVDIGRLHRAPGAALCGRRGWYEREPMESEPDCARCADIARRYAIERAVPRAALRAIGELRRAMVADGRLESYLEG